MCCYGYNTIWYALELAVVKQLAYRQLQTTEKLNRCYCGNHNHNPIGIINKNQYHGR